MVFLLHYTLKLSNNKFVLSFSYFFSLYIRLIFGVFFFYCFKIKKDTGFVPPRKIYKKDNGWLEFSNKITKKTLYIYAKDCCIYIYATERESGNVYFSIG